MKVRKPWGWGGEAGVTRQRNSEKEASVALAGPVKGREGSSEIKIVPGL